ncbi:MAG: class I SAM-dependent methyltransferase [Clostridia bacterium]|nr:class I SAM-dependent methyltransferase [Clostridia bacterium]
MNYLEAYYNAYDEEGRLLSRHGQVEYLTTMRYIHECMAGIQNPSVLEVGAGTGRYSIALAREGIKVTAVELIRHNIELFEAKMDGSLPVTVIMGNAMDLSMLEDSSYDLTLLLGPMYHLYTREDKLKALAEAVRVTKPGGYILAAYCMNEATIVQYAFWGEHLKDVTERGMLREDWHCISRPEDLFEMVRTEEIAALDAEFPVDRIKLVGTDGMTNYNRKLIDDMDDETFARWMDFHLRTCERQDMIGVSNHTLDILQKRR